MFRTAELGQTLAKQEYKQLEPQLRQELLALQRELRELAKTPVLIVFAGVDGAGKGATVKLLNDWMDTRWLINCAYREPSDEERERPPYWRFWRDLPPKGQVGLFMSSWLSKPVLDRAYEKTTEAQFDDEINRIIAFENALADDGALIIKFWMHLSQPEQKKRLRSLEKDPLLAWQVTERDWQHWRMYDQFVTAAERLIMRSNTAKASWHIVEGVDRRYREIVVATTIRDALRKHLADLKQRDGEVAQSPQQEDAALNAATVLSALDMTQTVDKARYKQQLKEYQSRLSMLQRHAFEKGISTLAVFEGPDAAGKGGAIRRVIAALDPHNYHVLPFAAPTDEERAHHYLWRFWRKLSRAGTVTIFDRSWYGRVLVERVEGFATQDEWQRAYAEINDFEAQLVEHDIVLLKFWLHIDSDEQLRRFQEREQIAHKSWKLTDEDWRNREKWDAYERAAHDMVQYTSTQAAPWVLVEGNDKKFARLKVLKCLCERLEQALL